MGHPVVAELCNYVFSADQESLLRDMILVISTLFLYFPSTVVFGGKFFHHCSQQRQNSYFVKQSWIIQYISCVIQVNTGGTIAFLLCGQTPILVQFASFLLPLMFVLWCVPINPKASLECMIWQKRIKCRYLCFFSPFDAVYRFYVSPWGRPVQVGRANERRIGEWIDGTIRMTDGLHTDVVHCI